MSVATVLPWQINQWQMLWGAKNNNRLPHALLILGTCGLGKMQFAENFASAVLCKHVTQDGQRCGNCHSCHLIQAKSHPDLVVIEPEDQGRLIKIDQIRSVIDFVNETALLGGYRVIIINRAHAMNHNAANALLKTLEEPTANTLLILLSGQGKRLQATITSRCQKISMHKPLQTEAIDWLQKQNIQDAELLLNFADGAPLTALSFATDDTMRMRQDFYQGLINLSQGKMDPLQLAAQLQESDVLRIFNLFFYWLQDILRLKLTAQQSKLINIDYRETLVNLSDQLSLEKLLEFLTDMQSRYEKLLNMQNFNRQLLLEELFIRWTQYYVSG